MGGPQPIGAPPPVGNGIPGQGLVLVSVAGGDPAAPGPGFPDPSREWEAPVPLLVTLPDRPVSHASPVITMRRAKHPIAGTTLPVTVDPDDPSHVRIEWDQVPTIDQWIEAGHPVFTDPDSVHRQLLAALDAYEASIARSMAGQAMAAVGPGAAISPELLPQLFERLRSRTQPPPPDLPTDHPTGRVLSASPPGLGSEGEVLLSVAVPGAARYGARWTGRIPGSKALGEWSDVPVRVDRSEPGAVEILWHEVPGVIEAAARRLHAMGDRLQAQLDQVRSGSSRSYEDLLSAVPDTARRDQIRHQIAQALGRSPVDPLDELKALGERRAAGTVTEEEFAAEKARLLESL